MKAHKDSRIIPALLLNLGINGYEWEFSHSRRFIPRKKQVVGYKVEYWIEHTIFLITCNK
jgi:hypothetical protein